MISINNDYELITAYRMIDAIKDDTGAGVEIVKEYKKAIRDYTKKNVKAVCNYKGDIWKIELPETITNKAEAIKYYWHELAMECTTLIYIGRLHGVWFAWVVDNRFF